MFSSFSSGVCGTGDVETDSEAKRDGISEKMEGSGVGAGDDAVLDICVSGVEGGRN